MTFDEIEQTNTDENTSASSEPSQSSAVSEPEAAGAAAGNGSTAEESKVPFHEHPRFRELVDQKNSYAKQLETLQREISEIRKASAPKPQETKDELIERLRGIDPQLADRMEMFQKNLGQVDEFKQWKEQQEAERIRTQALSMIDKWHTDNKVPAELRDLYQSQIELAAMRDDSIGLHNLKEVYDRVHGGMSKLVDSLKRAERESYVANKQSDARIPSSPKGKPTPANTSSIKSAKNPAEQREAMVQSVLQMVRAERNS